jgi:predicted metal-dependent hydrolase
MRFALNRGPERLSVAIAGQDVPVAVRRNARARRLILRLDPASGSPVLTLPARTPLAHGDAFLRKNASWLQARLERAPGQIPFAEGAVFPLRGGPCRIVHRGGRGLVRLEDSDGGLTLSVPGDAAHLPRRVHDWLKREARCDFEAAVARVAGALGKSATAVRIGDPRSRWGSCSRSGTLTFSWRLILAPPHVLHYLAAHEVAHLAEMNHGPRFWALVAQLDPDHGHARAWLKANGAGLHTIGRAAPDVSGQGGCNFCDASVP